MGLGASTASLGYKSSVDIRVEGGDGTLHLLSQLPNKKEMREILFKLYTIK